LLILKKLKKRIHENNRKKIGKVDRRIERERKMRKI
jgi:hypothetical protein